MAQTESLELRRCQREEHPHNFLAFGIYCSYLVFLFLYSFYAAESLSNISRLLPLSTKRLEAIDIVLAQVNLKLSHFILFSPLRVADGGLIAISGHP